MNSSKSDKALKTIGEVTKLLSIPAHVLRFWESNIPHIQPVKFNGRRYYSPKNIENIKQIENLLYQKNFSIKQTIDFLNKNKKKSQNIASGDTLLRIKEKLIAAREKLLLSMS